MSPWIYVRLFVSLLVLNIVLSGCYLLYVDRPFVYYEYLILPLFLVIVSSRLIQFTAIALLVSLDLLISLSHFYFFDSFNYLVKLPSLFISRFTLLQVLCGVIAFCLLLFMINQIRKGLVVSVKNSIEPIKKRILYFSAILFITTYIFDIYNGSSFLYFRPSSTNHYNIGKSLFRELFKDVRIYYKNYAQLNNITDYSMRTKRLPPAYSLLTDSVSKKQLLIILESWGLPQNPMLSRKMEEIFSLNLKRKYKLFLDSTISIGGTSQAEARELLNKSGGGLLLSCAK